MISKGPESAVEWHVEIHVQGGRYNRRRSSHVFISTYGECIEVPGAPSGVGFSVRTSVGMLQLFF